MSYQHLCQQCGSGLVVTGGTFTTRIPLGADGFAFADAMFVETQDEMVACTNCSYTGDLSTTEA